MMTGTFALLERSIRLSARHRQEHRSRLLAVLIILALLAGALLNPSSGAVPGLNFFRLLSLLSLALIVLAGLGYFVTAITEEREERTLGLLLLAGLSPVSILLGKSTNRIISAWLMFLAQFPFALLALSLGGITSRQIMAAYLALAMFLFLVANLGLLASVLARRGTQAVAILLLFLFCLLLGVPWLQYQLRLLAGPGGPLDVGWAHWGDALYEQFKSISIYHRLEEILTPRYQGGLWGVQATFSLVAGTSAFLLSWLVFRRIIWDLEESPPELARPLPASGSRSIHLIPRPGRWPLIWKDFHFIMGGYRWYAAKLLSFSMLAGLMFWRADWVRVWTDQSPVAALQSLLILWTAAEIVFACSQLFHSERKSGTLETLLLLPLSPAWISYQKLLGCLAAVLPNVLGSYLLVIVSREFPTSLATAERAPLIVLGGLFLVYCHLTLLCSLYVTRGGPALAAALLTVIAGIAFPVAGTMAALLTEAYGAHSTVSFAPLYYVIGAVCGGLQVAIGLRLEEVSST
jgi:ABC-type transport system involved in multi-copper enzyme maturation permease subunit